ncbi:MAG: hypothetical protein NZ518_11110, partial [Dehalococcoidia bacterium]|nr:hypothetical protein [Dehalococcoidia bacterium]
GRAESSGSDAASSRNERWAMAGRLGQSARRSRWQSGQWPDRGRPSGEGRCDSYRAVDEG